MSRLSGAASVGNATHFHKEEEIRVFALGGRPRTFLDVVLGNIDTLEKIKCPASNSRGRPTILLSYS